jgi:cytochrome c-type biogenesis protein
MGEFDISYGGAFIAGLLSFLSPCVLPLVPPYLCYLGGMTVEQLAEAQTARTASSRRVIWAALAFVLGFSTVFISLGATATFVGQFVAEYMDVLAKIAGVVIIVLGLHFLGLFRIALLFRELRFHIDSKPAGLAGAYVVGLAFAFGWTPCVGPVLAAVLFIAGTEESIWQGTSLLATYSAGLGVPFLAAAFAAGPFLKFMRRFRGGVRIVERVLGGALVVTGVLFITGSMSDIAFWILDTFPSLGRIG